MTEHTSDWTRWEGAWRQAGDSKAALADRRTQLSKARRALWFARLTEGVIAVVALLLLMGALKHAANPFEAKLGLLVGLAIGGLWMQRVLIRRREYAAADANSVEHLGVMRTVRLQQMRLARFIGMAIVLELAFLIPWWVIGSRVHRRSLTSAGTWLTMWLPILGMAGLTAWALRLWLRARRDVRSIEVLRDEYRETPV